MSNVLILSSDCHAGALPAAYKDYMASEFHAASDAWWIAAPISVIGSTLFFCLELFVSFLQAYIFTFLSALFIGAAIHHH